MTIQFKDDQILFVDGQIAMDPACCCGCAIGFEKTAWSYITSALPDVTVVTDLCNNIENLALCAVVFTGPRTVGDDATCFSETESLKSWVENGGKLWLGAESTGVLSEDEFAAYNSMLTYLGSTMQAISQGIECSGCRTTSDLNTTTPIMDDMPDINYAAACQITGGTWLIKNCLGTVIAAAEQIGDGIIFAMGDSNFTQTCDSNNILYQRIYGLAPSAML